MLHLISNKPPTENEEYISQETLENCECFTYVERLLTEALGVTFTYAENGTDLYSAIIYTGFKEFSLYGENAKDFAAAFAAYLTHRVEMKKEVA